MICMKVIGGFLLLIISVLLVTAAAITIISATTATATSTIIIIIIIILIIIISIESSFIGDSGEVILSTRANFPIILSLLELQSKVILKLFKIIDDDLKS
jgi:hypothetical protein